MIIRTAHCLLTALALIAGTSASLADSFEVSTPTTAAQTLASGQTGVVTSTGSITLSNSSVAVTFTGSSTLTNSGIIAQTGSNRALRSNTAGLTLQITNNSTGIFESKSDDTFQVAANGSNNNVTLNNYGIIRNVGEDDGQAIDWANITTGSNTLNNYSTGSITTTGADAVRLGVNGVLANSGLIKATPYAESPGVASGSDGVDLQNNTGAQITNSGTGEINGRHGITGGDDTHSVSFTVTNGVNAKIIGSNGSGLNIDNSASTVTLTNDGTIQGKYNTLYTDGDGDGVDVDGIVNITNNGVIQGLGAAGVNANDFGANNSEGISIGGGTIVNNSGAEISGNNTNGTAGRLGNGILVDDSNNGSAFAASSVTNSGLVRGYTGFAVKMVGNWNDTITNNATGTLRGGGAMAAVQTGGGADTVTNRGSIVGDGGAAVDLGDGDDTLKIEGGTITGSITGGTGSNTLVVDAGSGNAISYAGEISQFSTVEIKSGAATFTGTSIYTGVTKVSSDLSLVGANRLSASSSLEMNGGSLSLSEVGIANGQSFATFSLTGDSLIELNNTTSLTFNALGLYDGDSTLTINGQSTALSPYALRFLGDLTSDGAFLAFAENITINGHAAEVSFSSGYTTLAVPEPSTYALIAVALAVIAWKLRRAKALKTHP